MGYERKDGNNMAAAARRIEQGMRALFAFAAPVDLHLARRYLSPKELSAFQKMSRAEQLHSLQVLRRLLREAGRLPPALAVAALMHDVGKSRYHLAVWQKTLAVLVKRLSPDLAARLGRGEKLSVWRAPFVLSVQHAKWSAEILRGCDTAADALWLVEHHQADAASLPDHAQLASLRRLQRADDAC